MVFFKRILKSGFITHFQKKVPKKTLEKVVALSGIDIENTVKLSCPLELMTYNRDSTLDRLKGIDVGKFITDSSFKIEINKRQSEIFEIKDIEQREHELNELTKTDAFKRYTSASEFFTPRLIEFSKPIFVDQYCFLRVDIEKNRTDNRYSMIYVYKKNGSTWSFLDKWQVFE